LLHDSLFEPTHHLANKKHHERPGDRARSRGRERAAWGRGKEGRCQVEKAHHSVWQQTQMQSLTFPHALPNSISQQHTLNIQHWEQVFKEPACPLASYCVGK